MPIELGSAVFRVMADNTQFNRTLNDSAKQVDIWANALGTSVSRVAEFTMGQVFASAISRITQGLVGAGAAAIDAASRIQMFTIGIESMVARELARGQVIEKVTTSVVQLTAKESERLKALSLDYDILSARIQEQKEHIRQLTAQWGENGLVVITARARLADMENTLRKTGEEMDTLRNKQGQTVQSTQELVQGQMQLAEALALARPKAKELVEQISQIAILSPFTVKSVQEVYWLGMAFGFTADESIKFTKGILDSAAAIGADASMLQRMGYNMAQIRRQMNVTAMDVRQLAQAGFDLTEMLQFMGQKFGVVIKDHNDFNAAMESGKLKWKDFADTFYEYTQKNFAGAAERLAFSFFGLRNTLSDLFTLTVPKLIGPGLDRFTESMVALLKVFIDFRQSGVLEEWGKAITAVVDRVMGPFDKLIGKIVLYNQLQREMKKLSTYERGTARFNEEFPTGEFGTTVMPNLVTAFRQIREEAERIAAVFASLGKMFGFFLEGVKSLVTGTAEFVTKFVQLRDIVDAVVVLLMHKFVPTILASSAALLRALAPAMLLVGAIATLRHAWEENWLGIRNIVLPIISNIQDALEVFWAAFTGNFAKVRPQLLQIRDALDAAFGPGTMAKVLAAGRDFRIMLDQLAERGRAALRLLSDAIRVFAAAFTGNFDAVRADLVKIQEALDKAFGPGTMAAVLQAGRNIRIVFDELRAAFAKGGFVGIIKYLITKAPEWAAEMGKLVDRILLQPLVDWWKDKGKDLVTKAIASVTKWFNGVVSEIILKLPEWTDKIKSVIHSVWDALVGWWDNNGKALVTKALLAVGAWLIQLAKDVVAKLPEWRKKVEDTLGKLWLGIQTWWDAEDGGKKMATDALTKIGEWLGGVVKEIELKLPGWIEKIRLTAGKLWTGFVSWWDAPDGGKKLVTDTGARIGQWITDTATYIQQQAPIWAAQIAAELDRIWNGPRSAEPRFGTAEPPPPGLRQRIDQIIADVKGYISTNAPIWGAEIQAQLNRLWEGTTTDNPVTGETVRVPGLHLRIDAMIASTIEYIRTNVTLWSEQIGAELINVLTQAVLNAGTNSAQAYAAFATALGNIILGGFAQLKAGADNLMLAAPQISFDLGEIIGSLFGAALTLLTQTGELLGRISLGLAGLIFGAIKLMEKNVGDFAKELWKIVQAMISGGLAGGGKGMIELFNEQVDKLAAAMVGAFDKFFSGFFKGLYEHSPAWAKLLFDWFSDLWDQFVAKLTGSGAGNKKGDAAVPSGMKDSMLPIGEAVIDGIVEGIKSRWSALTAQAGEIVKAIKEDVEKLPGFMAKIGEDLITALADAMYDRTIGYLKARLRAIIDALPQWVKDWLGIASPSKVFMDIGYQIMNGLGLGIGEGYGEVLARLSTYMRQMVETFSALAKTLNSDMVWSAKAVTDPISATFDNLSKIANSIRDLAELVVADNLVEKVQDLVAAIKTVVETFAQLAWTIAPNTIWSAKAVSDPIAAIADNLSKAMTALDALGKWQGSISISRVQELLVTIQVLVNELNVLALVLEPDALAAAIGVSSAIGTLTTSLQSIPTLLDALNALDSADLSSDRLAVTLGELGDQLRSVVRSLIALGKDPYIKQLSGQHTSLISRLTEVVGLYTSTAQAIKEIYDVWESVGSSFRRVMGSSHTGEWNKALDWLKFNLLYMKGHLDAVLSAVGPVSSDLLRFAASLQSLMTPYRMAATAITEIFDLWNKVGYEYRKVIGPSHTGVWNQALDWLKFNLLFMKAHLEAVLGAIGPVSDELLEFAQRLQSLMEPYRQMMKLIADLFALWNKVGFEYRKVTGPSHTGVWNQALDWLKFNLLFMKGHLEAVLGAVGPISDSMLEFASRLTQIMVPYLRVIEVIRKVLDLWQTTDTDYRQVVRNGSGGHTGVWNQALDWLKFNMLYMKAHLEAVLGAIGPISDELLVFADSLIDLMEPYLRATEVIRAIYETYLGIDRDFRIPITGNLGGNWLSALQWLEQVMEYFVYHMKYILNKLGPISGDLTNFATALIELAAPFETAMEVVKTLYELWTTIDPMFRLPISGNIGGNWLSAMQWLEQVMEYFVYHLQYIMEKLGPISDEMVTFAERLTALSAPFTAAVTAMKTIYDVWITIDQDFRQPITGNLGGNWLSALEWLKQVLARMLLHLRQILIEVGPVPDALKALAEGLTALTGPYVAAAAAVKSLFEAWTTTTLEFRTTGYIEAVRWIAEVLREMLKQLSVVIAEWDVKSAEITKQFGDAVGSLFGGLKTALEFFKELQSWVGPTSQLSSRLKIFLTNVLDRFKEVSDFIAANIEPEALKTASEFGAAVGSLFGGLKSALDFFDALFAADPTTYSPEAEGESGYDTFKSRVAALMRGIDGTISAFRRWVASSSMVSWLPTAADFLDKLNGFVSTLRSALDLFRSIESDELPSLDKLQTFIDMVLELFQKMMVGLHGTSDAIAQTGEVFTESLQRSLSGADGILQTLARETDSFMMVGMRMGDSLVMGLEQAMRPASSMIDQLYETMQPIPTAYDVNAKREIHVVVDVNGRELPYEVIERLKVELVAAVSRN
jgi:hypothetical protein